MQDFLQSLQKHSEILRLCQARRDERYLHLDRNDIDKIRRILTEKQKWYEQTSARFNVLRQHEDPAVLCSQIKQEREVRTTKRFFFFFFIFLSILRISGSRTRNLKYFKQTKTERFVFHDYETTNGQFK